MIKSKSLIAMSVAVLIGLPSVANAFTEATGGSIGTLVINGTMVNADPTWEWQIPSVTALQALNTTSLEGVYDASSDKTSYDLLSTTVEFLQGRMKTAAKTGSTGLVPTIKFGSTSLNTDNSETIELATTTPGSGAIVAIDISKHVAVVRNSGSNTYADGNDARSYPLFQELITDFSPWGVSVSSVSTSSGTTSTSISGLMDQLRDTSVTNVQGSYGLSTTGVRLVADAGVDVSTWEVAIPIQVEVN